jgi:hypothetical protein
METERRGLKKFCIEPSCCWGLDWLLVVAEDTGPFLCGVWFCIEVINRYKVGIQYCFVCIQESDSHLVLVPLSCLAYTRYDRLSAHRPYSFEEEQINCCANRWLALNKESGIPLGY